MVFITPCIVQQHEAAELLRTFRLVKQTMWPLLTKEVRLQSLEKNATLERERTRETSCPDKESKVELVEEPLSNILIYE